MFHITPYTVHTLVQASVYQVLPASLQEAPQTMNCNTAQYEDAPAWLKLSPPVSLCLMLHHFINKTIIINKSIRQPQTFKPLYRYKYPQMLISLHIFHQIVGFSGEIVTYQALFCMVMHLVSCSQPQ